MCIRDRKCVKNVLRTLFYIFLTFKAVFVTLNAPRGRGSENAATSGSLYGAENGLKMTKNGKKMS